MANRRDEKFLPLEVKKKALELEHEGETTVKKIEQIASSFYDTSYEYLQQWSAYYDEYCAFGWIQLNDTLPEWNFIEQNLSAIVKILDGHASDGQFFDQFKILQRFISKDMLGDWDRKNVSCDQRWLQVFSDLSAKSIDCNAIAVLVEYFLCLPGW